MNGWGSIRNVWKHNDCMQTDGSLGIDSSILFPFHHLGWPRRMEVLIKLHVAFPSRCLPWTWTPLPTPSCRTLVQKDPVSTEWPKAGSLMALPSWCPVSPWTHLRSRSLMTSKMDTKKKKRWAVINQTKHCAWACPRSVNSVGRVWPVSAGVGSVRRWGQMISDQYWRENSQVSKNLYALHRDSN